MFLARVEGSVVATKKDPSMNGRKLLLVPRETPLSVIHLENLTALARAGATIIPAMPAFYTKPRTLEDAVDGVVARILDHVDIPHELARRWGAEGGAK